MNFDELLKSIYNTMMNYNVEFSVILDYRSSKVNLKVNRWSFCATVEIDYYTTDINLVPNICHNLVKKLESHIVKDLYK